MVKFTLIASAVLAVGMTTFAAAGDVSTDETAVIQNINVASAVNQTRAVNRKSKVGSRDTATNDDNMAGYLAVVTAVLADNDRSDDLADNSDNGDDRRYRDLGSRHQGHLERHLGLGFAHGMGNKSKLQKGGNKKGNGRINPHNDDCHGNGHSGNPGGNGHGHEDHGNGNGFGHRDCGEPSPAD